ncbi:hypothetical protein [Streptomyces sp. 058-1L]|uniref:hypothetical protein n=1 Tax=Streptomyces sp. 058-1L TaxID=2789266 RepID=UPI00398188E8
MHTRTVMAALVLLAGAALAGTSPATATPSTATPATGPQAAPRAAAPGWLRAFQNLKTEENLSEQNGRLHARGTDAWVLYSPPGAPQGVYQIQARGTNNCIKALSQDTVGLATCANNPGRPQRWKLDSTLNSVTDIESRQYPGRVITQTQGGRSVILHPKDSEDDGDQFWNVLQVN